MELVQYKSTQSVLSSHYAVMFAVVHWLNCMIAVPETHLGGELQMSTLSFLLVAIVRFDCWWQY